MIPLLLFSLVRHLPLLQGVKAWIKGIAGLNRISKRDFLFLFFLPVIVVGIVAEFELKRSPRVLASCEEVTNPAACAASPPDIPSRK